MVDNHLLFLFFFSLLWNCYAPPLVVSYFHHLMNYFIKIFLLEIHFCLMVPKRDF